VRPVHLRVHGDAFKVLIVLQDANVIDNTSRTLYDLLRGGRPFQAIYVRLRQLQQRPLRRMSDGDARQCARLTIHIKMNFSGTTDTSL
jgi:hypothetical protein